MDYETNPDNLSKAGKQWFHSKLENYNNIKLLLPQKGQLLWGKKTRMFIKKCISLMRPDTEIKPTFCTAFRENVEH